MVQRATRGPAPRPGASRREFIRVSGVAALATGGLSLTGCGIFGGEDPTTGGGGGGGAGEAGSKTLRFSFVPVETLDPQVITNGMWLMTKGVLEGLVAQNEGGDDVVPAVATEWTVSDDLLTYTFTLRDDAKWSNGDPVVASDFERTYERLFTPAGTSAGGTTTGANSYQATTGIKGAVDFLAGTLTDWAEVGVKATSDTELVLTLEAPNPDFLLALTHPALLPLHMDTVEGKPDDWGVPPNYVSNGPYMVQDWVQNSEIVLLPNEDYWDQRAIALDQINVKLVEPTTSGTATVPYENDEVDILQIADADVLRFEKDPELAEHLHSVDTYSLAYLAKLRSEHPALDDVRVRKALSLGMSRETMASVAPGMRPGVSLVHDRIDGWDESLAVQENIDEAKQLLADAGYPNGEGLPEVRILAGVQSPLVDALIDTWKNNLGIKARADVVDAGVYVERRWQVQEGDYIGYYFGTFAGLPTMATYVGTLWSPTNVQEISLGPDDWTKYQETQLSEELSPGERTAQLEDILNTGASDGAKEMEELTLQAMSESDEAAQNELFLEAAKLREEEYLYVPLSWISSYFAVRPTVQGVQLRRYPDFFYFKPIEMTDS